MALPLVEQLPNGYSSLRDQLRRAAFSIALNIAEGTGKTQPRDRKRYYAIARGSAMECAAICDIIELIDEKVCKEMEQAKSRLDSIVAILTRVCREGEGD